MRRSVETSDLLKVIRAMLLYKSLFATTLKLQKHKHIGIKENAEILVQCYCISSNNSRPSIIASLEYPPPPPLSPSSIPDPDKFKCNVIHQK